MTNDYDDYEDDDGFAGMEPAPNHSRGAMTSYEISVIRNLCTVFEFDADDEPRGWIVRDLVPTMTVTMLTANEEDRARKLALQLIAATATEAGRVLGVEVNEAHSGTAVVWARPTASTWPHGFHAREDRRLRGAFNGSTPAGPVFKVHVPRTDLGRTGCEIVEKLQTVMEHLASADKADFTLVVVDNLATLLGDVLTYSEVEAVMSALEKMAEEWGIAIILLCPEVPGLRGGGQFHGRGPALQLAGHHLHIFGKADDLAVKVSGRWNGVIKVVERAWGFERVPNIAARPETAADGDRLAANAATRLAACKEVVRLMLVEEVNLVVARKAYLKRFREHPQAKALNVSRVSDDTIEEAFCRLAEAGEIAMIEDVRHKGRGTRKLVHPDAPVPKGFRRGPRRSDVFEIRVEAPPGLMDPDVPDDDDLTERPKRTLAHLPSPPPEDNGNDLHNL